MTLRHPSLFDPAVLVAMPTEGQHHAQDLGTAVKAAKKQVFRAGSHRVRILHWLASHPEGATAHELHAATGGAYPHVAATRCLELLEMRLVERSEETRKTPTGDEAHVWLLTVEGQRVAREVAA